MRAGRLKVSREGLSLKGRAVVCTRVDGQQGLFTVLRVETRSLRQLRLLGKAEGFIPQRCIIAIELPADIGAIEKALDFRS
jgi:hypothetical protein